MIYLASPYSHADADVRERRFQAVASFVSHIMLTTPNIVIYSPILHSHQLASLYGLPDDFYFWQTHSLHMLDLSSSMWVLALDGYRNSRGVQEETLYAAQKEIPIRMMTPVFDEVHIQGFS